MEHLRDYLGACLSQENWFNIQKIQIYNSNTIAYFKMIESNKNKEFPYNVPELDIF